jgi:hypothetical protein
MSARDNLHPQQLKMFMTPDEIIDTAHKSDSMHTRFGYDMDLGDAATPRQQWEREYFDPHGSPAVKYGAALREEKLIEVDGGAYYSPEEKNAIAHDGRPLELLHTPEKTYLSDGHHRLAYHERQGTPYLPVKHRKGVDR